MIRKTSYLIYSLTGWLVVVWSIPCIKLCQFSSSYSSMIILRTSGSDFPNVEHVHATAPNNHYPAKMQKGSPSHDPLHWLIFIYPVDSEALSTF